MATHRFRFRHSPVWLTIAVLAALGSVDALASPIACDLTAAQMLARGGDSDWSHAKDLIAYDQLDDASVYQLRTIRPDGTDDTCLSCTAPPGAPRADRHKIAPVWHPSGEYLVLQGEMPQHPLSFARNALLSELQVNGLWMNLYAATPDGSQWWRLTDYASDRGDGAMAPHFSADGTRLLWSRMVDREGQDAPWGKWRLMIADFVIGAGGAPSLENIADITPSDSGLFFESHGFSPDGQKVIFTSDRDAPNMWVMNVWTMDLTTGALTNLTRSNHWQEHSSFTPDGQSITYMSSQPYDLFTWLGKGQSGTELFLMGSDGSNQRQLTHFNVPGFPESDTNHISLPHRATWSADGARLALTRQLGGRDYPTRELWQLTFAGPCGAPTDST